MEITEKFRFEKIPVPDSIFNRNHSKTLAGLLKQPGVSIIIPEGVSLSMKWNKNISDKEVDLLLFQIKDLKGYPVLFTLPEIRAIIPVGGNAYCRIIFNNGLFCNTSEKIGSQLTILGRIYFKGSQMIHVAGYTEDFEKQITNCVDAATLERLLVLPKEREDLVRANAYEKAAALRDEEKGLFAQIESTISQIEKDLAEKYNLK